MNECSNNSYSAVQQLLSCFVCRLHMKAKVHTVASESIQTPHFFLNCRFYVFSKSFLKFCHHGN